MNKEYLTAKETAEFLGIKPHTLANARFHAKSGQKCEFNIPYSKIGKHILYSLTDLRAFVEKNKVNLI